jgi:hypothetical protein
MMLPHTHLCPGAAQLEDKPDDGIGPLQTMIPVEQVQVSEPTYFPALFITHSILPQ